MQDHNPSFQGNALALGIALGIALPSQANAAPTGHQGIAARTLSEIASLEQEKARRTPAQQKIDSNLLYADRKLQTGVASPAAARLEPAVKVQPDGRVLVDIAATVSDELLAFITNAGGNVINNFVQYNAIRAVIPLRAVESLAARTDVRFVHRAHEPSFSSCTTTGANYEGDTCHRACNARDTYGVDGTGVKVGVLSDSVLYLSNAQAAGTLGPVTVLAGQSGTNFPGIDGEGTAMLEIVHRIAPGAQLYFATGGLSPSQMAANILALAAAGCNIIVDDITYPNESPFQESQPISEAVHVVSDQGVLFFSSAGNYGNYDRGASGTWNGDFSDGGPVGPPISGTTINGKFEMGRLHNFGGGANYDILLASTPAVALFWSDPLGASTNDYDLFVLGPSGVVGASTSTQNGTQDPFESVVGNVIAGYEVVVVRFSGANRFLQLENGTKTQFAGFSISTPGRVRGHNCVFAANAFCVAATDVANAYPFPFSGGAAAPVESFSSDGPHHLFYYPNGQPITPGNFSSTGGFRAQKPDITAGDGVHGSAVPRFSPFFGTSAAAPQAAGIAALVLSKNLSQTPYEVRTALQATALDIMTNGVDRDSGYGIVMAYPAVGIVSNITSLANSWITSANGKWEIGANWSKGVGPTTAHVAVIISNAPGKTVTIDNVTTNTPANLTINSLTVSAPAGSTNALFLNRAGPAMPLNVLNGVVLDTNGVLVANGSEVASFSGGLVVAKNGASATLIVTNGGLVYDDSCLLGLGSNAKGSVLVSGPGSLLYNFMDLDVGVSGSGNSLTLSNQAQILSTRGAIGYNAGSTANSILVTGAGSVWYNNPNPKVGNLWVGFNGSGNTLTIANGGAVYSENAFVGANSDNNAVAVSGAGSHWVNNFDLYIGQTGATNQLTVSDNGSVIASNVYVGFGYTNSGNRISIAGGTLQSTATLDVRGGTLTLNSGTLNVGSLVASNGANSVIQFNGGAVNAVGAFITNGQTFVVGNGTAVATHHVLGGTHYFASGLRVRSNAFLTGCGTIIGNVTVDPGGSVAADCGGTLTFTGTVTNNGIMHAENRGVLEAYGRVVNNGIIDIMDGTTNFHSTLINNGSIVDASSFRVTSITRQSNDINITWTAVGGRSYVVQTNAPAAGGGSRQDFRDLTGRIDIPGTTLGTTNHFDTGRASNAPASYYRVRLVP